MSTPTLIGYARVSTLDQDPALQTDALTEAGCARIFEEKASGARADRPALMAAMDYVRPGDVLVVWKLDRLARSMKQLLATIDDLQARGIGFRCLTHDIDTTTASGRFMLQIFAALSEFEREIIRERTKAGLKAAVARGRKGGRRPVLDETQRAMAKTLMKDRDLAVKDIAERLGVSVATLYNAFPGGRTALLEEE